MRADDRSTSCWSTTSPAKLLSYEAILEELGENLITADSGQRGARAAAAERDRAWC